MLAASEWCIPLWGNSHSPTFRQILMAVLLTRWIFALLTPGVLWFSARFPFGRGHWVRTLAWHGVGAFGFLVLWVSIRLPLYPMTDQLTQESVGPSWRLYHDMILEDALYAAMMYGTIVAVSQVWEYYRKYRERELHASRLEAELAQAELKVLKMQMDPQFLFATLRSIATLIHQDVEAADDLVASLSELLRISLDDGDEQEVTLKREIDYLNAYLEVQKIRFSNRLAVHVKIDPKALDALVPNMILPALVENILRPDFEESHRAHRVEINSEVREGKLCIEIHNDVPWRRAGEESLFDGDPGLANVKARLQHLYGASHKFGIGLKPPDGSTLTLELPLVLRRSRPAELPAVEPVFEVS
jgi:two-component system LytT family sensor kinase